MRIDELNAKILKGLSGKEKEDFLAGLALLNMDNPTDRVALREAIKRLRPDFTPEQIEIFVEGRVKPDTGWHFKESDDFWPDRVEQLSIAVRALHPGKSDEEIAAWVASHEGRAITNKSGSSGKSAQAIVQDLEREDAEKAAEQAIPDALTKLHPKWDRETVNEWVSQHDSLIKSFQALHPEWSADALITAIDNEVKTSGPLPWGGE